MDKVSERIGRYAKPFFHRTHIGRCPKLSSRAWAEKDIASRSRCNAHLCATWVKDWFFAGTRMRHGTSLPQADEVSSLRTLPLE